jgi:uncharacterized protein (TIRG00374 family)
MPRHLVGESDISSVQEVNRKPLENEDASRRPRRLSWFWIALKFVVTGIILVYIASRVDLRAVGENLKSVSIPILTLSIGFLLLIPFLGGARWWMVLRAIGRPDSFAPLAALFWVGMLFSQVVPAAASDGIRIWIASRRGPGLEAAIHSVLLERVSMVLMLLIVVVATEPLLLDRIGAVELLWVAPALFVAGSVGLVVLMVADRLTVRFIHWDLIRSVARFSVNARQVVLSVWALPLALLGTLTHLNFVFAAALLGTALSLPLSFLDYLAFIPMVTVSMILPISFSGWGVREGVLVALLGTVSIPAQSALAFSLLFGACVTLSSLPGLAVWFLNSDRKAPRTGHHPDPTIFSQSEPSKGGV